MANEAITVSTDLLEAVAGWALPEGERPNLSQIVFRDDEMIACDARRAVIVPIKTHGHAFGLWRSHAFAAIAAQDALVKADTTIAIRRRSARTIAITPIVEDRPAPRLRIGISGTGEESLIVHACTETQPIDRLRELLTGPPPTSAPGVIGFDPSYLAAIDDITRAIEPARRGVRITRWGDEVAPMVFEGDLVDSATRRARFVIMPMRI